MAVARLGKQSGESLHVHQGNPSKVTGASPRGRRPCCCGSELRADETTADGVTDQARRVVDIELRHDPGPVILRGLDAHAPEPSDLFRCLSLHHQLQATDVVDANRVNAFRTDPRLPIDQNASCDDYAGSGFDRGHMVPRSDMNRSQVAMVNTFFLTNPTPQRPNVNQGAWARLEDWVRAWAKSSGWVHVISGSVFDDDDDQQPDDPADAQLSQGSSGAAVPSHYYKVIIRETTAGQVEAITLLIPNAANVPGRGAQHTTPRTTTYASAPVPLRRFGSARGPI